MATPINRRPLMFPAAVAFAVLLAFAGCASADLSTGTGPPVEGSGDAGPPVTIQY